MFRCDRPCDRLGRCDTYRSGGRKKKGGRAAASEAVSLSFTAIAAAIDFYRCDMYRSGGAYLSMFSFAGVKLWLNCQPGVLSLDLGQYFFGCCLVNSCGGAV